MDSSEQRLRRRLKKGAVSTLMLATPFFWTKEATHEFSEIPQKEAAVGVIGPLSDSVKQGAAFQLQDQFTSVTAGYNARDRKVTLTEAEANLARSHLHHYELLAESPPNSQGFYGSVLRDSVTHKTILNFAGMDATTSAHALYDDLDDALMSTTCGKVSQFPNAVAFARDAQKRFGIDIITGHSLGGHLALLVKGMGLCPQAECFVYDPPGVTTTTVDVCADASGLSKSQVIKNLRENCYSFTVTHNSYNDLGQQPGIALTLNNTKNGFFCVVPKDHLYKDEYVNTLADAKAMTERENQGQSGGPPLITAVFLLLATLPYAKDIKRGLQGSRGNAER